MIALVTISPIMRPSSPSAPCVAFAFAFVMVVTVGACAPDGGLPEQIRWKPVQVAVEPLVGNSPLSVTVISDPGEFATDECDLSVLGVPTGADLNASYAQ